MSIKKIQTRDGIKLRNTKTNKLTGSVGKGKEAPKVQSPIKRHRWKIPLSESHPDVLSEIYNWDPSKVTAGSRKLKELKCKTCGSIRLCSPQRLATKNGPGLLFCTTCPRINLNSLSLLKEFPEIAKEAYGWDPNFETSHSGKKMPWKCDTCNHIWPAKISNRTDLATMSGCPPCSKKKALVAKAKRIEAFSLASLFPTIAAEAYQWDPLYKTPSSGNWLPWKCSRCKEVYYATPRSRIGGDPYGSQCPHKEPPSREHFGRKRVYIEIYGQRIVVCDPSNSLLSKRPDLLIESSLTRSMAKVIGVGSVLNVPWKCQVCGWRWSATVNNRVNKNQGCPKCSKTGYDNSKPGTVYFVKGLRNNREIIQYGITNNIKERLSYHKRNGFFYIKESEFAFFLNGGQAAILEKEIKNVLKDRRIASVKEDSSSSDKYPGYTESVYSDSLPNVNCLRDLISFLGIQLVPELEWIGELV